MEPKVRWGAMLPFQGVGEEEKCFGIPIQYAQKYGANWLLWRVGQMAGIF